MITWSGCVSTLVRFGLGHNPFCFIHTLLWATDKQMSQEYILASHLGKT
jgi:hypothetical protein